MFKNYIVKDKFIKIMLKIVIKKMTLCMSTLCLQLCLQSNFIPILSTRMQNNFLQN